MGIMEGLAWYLTTTGISVNKTGLLQVNCSYIHSKVTKIQNESWNVFISSIVPVHYMFSTLSDPPGITSSLGQYFWVN